MSLSPLADNPDSHIELFRFLRTLVDVDEHLRRPHSRFSLVEAYWHIGRIIVETEQQGRERAEYGIQLIENLSAQLSAAFGKGYSMPNMWRFKQFYLAFQILSTVGREFTNLRNHLREELNWSHYRELMQLKDPQERAFYLQTAADEGWTVRYLQRMIRSRYYHQAILGEESFPATVKKEPTALLPGRKPASPRSRIALIRKTLLERYVGFAFVTQRQFLSVNGQERWAELVFFHILLNRYVLVQLGEHDPLTKTTLRQLLDAYLSKQPPGFATLPVGLLVNQKNGVKVVTASPEPSLSPDDLAHFPSTFA